MFTLYQISSKSFTFRRDYLDEELAVGEEVARHSGAALSLLIKDREESLHDGLWLPG